jgi:hypothetical protein
VSREPQTLELEGLTVSSQPLPFEKAEDILPEIGQLIAMVMERAAGALANLPAAVTLKSMDVVTLARLLGPVLASVADKLGGGTLKRLAPLVLASTTVVYTDATGAKAAAAMMKASDRADVFNEHPEAYFPILFFAGKVTFYRFFPGSALAANTTKLA